MARRRMFSLDVVDTDAFLDLPSSSQALYFHLGMRADDDGFVSSPKRITATVSASPDDLRLLISKGFLIPFSSGVCVIRDWRKNNYIQTDRRTETAFVAEKAQLLVGADRAYQLSDTKCIQDVSVLDTQIRLGQDSSEKRSKVYGADKPPRTRFIPPTLEEVAAYCRERGNKVDPQRFHDFYSANGWRQGRGKPIRDWRAAVRTWETGRQQERQPAQQQPDLSWRDSRSVTPDELVEYPEGSGHYRPRSEVPHD